MRERSSAKAVVRNYYGFQLFFSLLVWLPIFYEYQKHFGLSDAEIFAIQSLYYLAFCLLEIPTGLVADLWGYRRCMQAGAVALALTHLLPIFDPTYSGFLLHFMGIAVARSLISGASSAYLYEHLKQEGLSDEFRKVEGRSRAYALIAKVFAWGAVGSLMTWHVTSPYWLTFVAALISAIYAWRLPPSPQLIVATDTLRELVPVLGRRLSHSLILLWRSPYLIFLTLQGIAIFILGRIVQVNLFQPILISKEIALPLHGMIMAAMTVFEALGSAYPHMLRRFLNDRNAVFVLTALLGGALILIPSAGLWMAVVILCLFAFWGGLAYPIQRQLFNDAIPDSSYRATLMSMESIIDRAACAWVASLLAAAMAHPSGLNRFLLASGLITLFGTLLLSLVFTLRKKSP